MASRLRRDYFFCFIRRSNAPHLIECIHVKRKVIYFTFIICQWAVDKTVKLREAVYIFPNIPIIGMEDMRPVTVNFNAVTIFGINIAADMRPLFNYKAGLARALSAFRKNRAEKPRPYNKKIVFCQGITFLVEAVRKPEPVISHN